MNVHVMMVRAGTVKLIKNKDIRIIDRFGVH